MMGTQAAGRERFYLPQPIGPLYAAPWSTVRAYRGRPLPRPAATPSHHMQVGGLSVCVSSPVFLWLTTKGHAKGPHCCCTPTMQAPLAFAYPCMAVRPHKTPCSHPRRLHAHAAHRVPTPRADRPPCRPDTGMRPSCSHSRVFSIDDARSPFSGHCCLIRSQYKVERFS
jgi:hypothetical protein